MKSTSLFLNLNAMPEKKQKLILHSSGLLLFILCANFSQGFLSLDAHFQILEFANYKLGNIGVDVLPWEFAEKIRPWQQPFFTFGILSLLSYIRIHDPFVQVNLIQNIVGLISFLSIYMIMESLKFKTIKEYFFIAFLFYFVFYSPSLHVRNASEIMSTNFLIFSYVAYFKLRHKKEVGF